MGNAAPRELPPVDMTPSIIDEQVGEHCIFLYSTTVCGYCTKAKSLLNHINAEFGVAELDTMSSRESGNVFNNLVKRTNCRTVPQVFINGTFIGGYSELNQLYSTQKLMEKLSECSKPCIKPKL